MQGIDAESWPLKCCSGYFISSDGVITFLFLLGPPGNLKKYKKKENYYASDSSSRCMILPEVIMSDNFVSLIFALLMSDNYNQSKYSVAHFLYNVT